MEQRRPQTPPTTTQTSGCDWSPRRARSPLALLPPGVEQKAEDGFLGIGWGAPEESARSQFFIIGSWDRDDGLLRDGLDGTPLAADTLKALRRQSITGDAAVLADAESGGPRPLPVRVPARALGTARALLDRGERSMQAFVRAIGAELVVPGEPVRLDSINTPQDYARVADGQDAD